MRNLVSVFLVFTMLLCSCRKDRSCTCTINESGTKTLHSQTAGTSVEVIPGVPIVIVPPTDTTFDVPYNTVTTSKTNYNKVSKGAMRKNCPESYSEGVSSEDLNVVPGTSTLSTIQSGSRSYSCKIE